ncbi:MAG: DUF411 domain-containing protein [Arenicella sp.]
MRKNLKYYTLLLFTVLLANKAIASNEMQVYKSPNCGCCVKWVSHLEDNGFSSSTFNKDAMSMIKDELNIPKQYRSCHTGVVIHSEGKYIFEGHVPAETIKRFLSNPPENALGLSVPGMPVGSPGMEVGSRKDYYEVLLLLNNGDSKVYEKMNG